MKTIIASTMNLLLVCLFCTLPIVLNGTPMSCIAISTSYFFENKITAANYSVNANWDLFVNSGTNKTYLILSDVQGLDTKDNVSVSSILYDYYYSNDIHQNTTDFTKPFTFELFADEPLVWFYAYFQNYWQMLALMNYIDDGMISNPDGALFDPAKPCLSTKAEDSTMLQEATTCCLSFIPALEVPTDSYPKCSKFRSRIILLNSDYSTFATSSLSISLNEAVVNMAADFSGSDAVTYLFNGDSCNSTGNSNFTCQSHLPAGDSKSFFATLFFKNGKQYVVPRVRAFLLRNNQTLMKDGTPFTSKNNCMYYKFAEVSAKDGGPTYPTTVEICCQEFLSF